MNELSERAKELIPQAQIMSFEGWSAIGEEAIAILQSANSEKKYLTDEDLIAISAELAITASVQQLRDQAPAIVDEARAGVLKTFPGILEPGGGLYPAMRAEACWRDFWHFLRCITYGIAGKQPQFTSPDGLIAMEQLYQELQVPLPAMVKGLEGLKEASLSRFDEPTQAELAPYFDHLIGRMAGFLQ